MKDTGLREVNIMLPNTEDFTSFACVACDQFTSEKEYWQTLENMVKNKKTALDLVLPEIYLEDNLDTRIAKINQNIQNYLDDGSFRELEKGFVLTVRKTPYVQSRVGLIGAIDLEKYEYSKKSEALIRSTEGTIEERIPPRLKIRKDAPVEFPHIMLLIDDEKREIIENIYKGCKEEDKLYDFELNMGGGHLTGYFVKDYENVKNAFAQLLDDERLTKKYGKVDNFAFAVGDGNHSLATAKTHWNNIKKDLTEAEKENHPARFALCEIVNVYDEGIYFEPIHRFVFGVDRQEFTKGLKGINGGKICVYDGKENFYEKDNTLPLGITAVDDYIKDYISKFGGGVDYIHGDENLKKLVDDNETAVGIMFEKLDKNQLFPFVSTKGAFSRKTFSMGEGIEKRYYLEGRKIK